MSGYNVDYVKKQFKRYSEVEMQNQKDDCLYRAGTHLDVELPSDGVLNDEQRAIALSAINKFFKSTNEG